MYGGAPGSTDYGEFGGSGTAFIYHLVADLRWEAISCRDSKRDAPNEPSLEAPTFELYGDSRVPNGMTSISSRRWSDAGPEKRTLVRGSAIEVTDRSKPPPSHRRFPRTSKPARNVI